MIKVIAQEPEQLVEDIRTGIAEGDIITWEESPQGSFTHTSSSGDWRKKAWFKPRFYERGVAFNIIRPKGGRVSKEVYAVYHGRFSEMLLAHFDAAVSEIRLTALAGDGDLV